MLNVMYTSGSVHCGVTTSLHVLREDTIPPCTQDLPCQQHRLECPHLDVATAPVSWELTRRWSHGGVGYDLDIRNIQSRYVGLGSLEAVAKVDDALRREVEFIRQVDVIVLVLNTTRAYLPHGQRRLRRVAADLGAVGRLDVPIVFQLGFRDADPADPDPRRQPVPIEEIKQMFTWPRCDHVEAFPSTGRGVKEALDRAIDLYEETQAERGGGTDETE